jgi:L-arabinokinase
MEQATIAYYVTGHGLGLTSLVILTLKFLLQGHATRSVFSIQYLLNKGHVVHIISSISSSFFLENINSQHQEMFHVHTRVLDGGAVQLGPLQIDGHVTLERYFQNIHHHHPNLLMNEINFILENKIQIVLTDATPLACSAGHQAGCQVMILSNFTWDEMYSGMLNEILSSLTEEEVASYRQMITQCSADYSVANFYLQLPGAVPITSFPPLNSSTSTSTLSSLLLRQHALGPLICRNSLRTRREILEQYSLLQLLSPSTSGIHGKHILLIGFGGHDVPWDILRHPSSLPVPDDWICLILGGTEPTTPSLLSSSEPSRVISIPYHCYVPDLISISSVVMGKLGYGFMSECLAHDVPMLYLTRSCWPEEIYLRDYMTNYRHKQPTPDTGKGGGRGAERVNCLEMKFEDFLGGKWEDYLATCLRGREGWDGDEEKEAEKIRTRQAQQEERLAEIYSSIVALGRK